jgi:hypothetical protein
VRSRTETNVHSGLKSDFYRIYRVESAADVVRSTATGIGHVQSLTFNASGGQLSQLFDGTEQMIIVIALPWYSRQVTLSE